jgi:hypothetical protein
MESAPLISTKADLPKRLLSHARRITFTVPRGLEAWPMMPVISARMTLP